MTIDFHNNKNRATYAERAADLTWVKKIKDICNVEGKTVLDIGCGGGIYTKELAKMEAATVTGLDFSDQQLSAAKENCKDYSNVTFHKGNALDTMLMSGQFDIVLERAVIHHIKDIKPCFKEVFRLLKPGGICLIQDRTSEDCVLEGNKSHIRGYFFSKFPHLISKDISRRHSSEKVTKALQEAGFQSLEAFKLWEVRKIHNGIADLEADITGRVGRSILHDLTDKQIQDLVTYIREQLDIDPLNANKSIIEKDRWTLWHGRKSACHHPDFVELDV